MSIVIPMSYCDRATFAEPHASLFLEKYGHLLTWKSDEKEIIADIGCANGAVTNNVLLPFCQSKTHELIGVDIASKMVQLANEMNKNTNVSFQQMDVAKKNIDDNFVGKFHHIFSFYCLHMIADQRQCAENLYKMLKPGGEAFLTFLIRNNMIQTWFDLCEHVKWSGYLEHFPNNFSNYQKCDRPQEHFESVYRDAGFAVESYVEHKTHVFADRQTFEGFLIDINLLIHMIPESLKDDFVKDLLEMMHSRVIGDDYGMNMEVVVGIVRKPLN